MVPAIINSADANFFAFKWISLNHCRTNWQSFENNWKVTSKSSSYYIFFYCFSQSLELALKIYFFGIYRNSFVNYFKNRSGCFQYCFFFLWNFALQFWFTITKEFLCEYLLLYVCRFFWMFHCDFPTFIIIFWEIFEKIFQRNCLREFTNELPKE